MKFIVKALLAILLGLLLISCGTKSTDPEDDQVATPAFSTGGGTYDAAVDVLISCTTANAIIRYTLNGTEPNSASTVYTAVLHIAANTTLKAKAYKSGWISSSTRSATYQFTAAAAPVINPAGGTYTTAQTVSMYCATPNAHIRYTTDGTDPTEASVLYASPITVSSNTTIKSRAYVAGITPSPVTTESYAMQVSPPMFSPGGGSFPVSQIVSITCATAGARINYTLDGTEPTEASNVYTNPLNIAANTIITAKAYKTGWNASEMVVTAYQINIPDQMVYIQGGTFDNGEANVTLSPFYIARYEVNQFDWIMIMGTNPFFYPDEEDAPPVPDLPAETVSWLDAIEYCNWRSYSEGYTPCYSYGVYGVDPTSWPAGWNMNPDSHLNISCDWDANGYRLPTEMEWMFAARGGNISEGYLYSGSNNVDDVAWYTNNSADKTSLVGLKQPNELGLYDMSGNVWEYCWDIFAPLPTTDQVNPVGATTGNSRAIRGGSCLQDESNCTIARRFNLLPLITTNVVGLRVARKAW